MSIVKKIINVDDNSTIEIVDDNVAIPYIMIYNKRKWTKFRFECKEDIGKFTEYLQELLKKY